MIGRRQSHYLKFKRGCGFLFPVSDLMEAVPLRGKGSRKEKTGFLLVRAVPAGRRRKKTKSSLMGRSR